MKKDINDTFAGLSFDASVLPVPEQNTVTFCDQMDTSLVDNLGHDLIKIAKIGTVLLIALALLLVAANCALEWYKWRCLKDHLRYTREAWSSDPTIYHAGGKAGGTPTVQLSDHNLLMLQGNMMHPLLTKIANRMSALLRLSPSKHIHLSWFFHYVFHPPALACFLIGFFGLLSVEVQLLAISPLEHKYQQQAVASVSDFSNLIATSINASMYNQSAAYASDVNGRVDHIQSQVNDGLFGWVNGTTSTLNDTINTFYTDLQNAVQTVFNGTILESPIEEFIRCFIGSKVDAIENALTFLHNNLNIDIPRVNDSVLVLSPASVNEATQPIATAAIGGGQGDNQGVVGKLVNAYVESLKKERVMFSVFMGLWGFVVFMALAVVFWHSYGRDWAESYKKRKWQKKQRAGIDDIVVPFRDFSNDQGDIEKVNRESRSFIPMPAPKPGLFSNLRMAGISGGKSSSLAPGPYPLGGGQPGFQKSWDSFLDAAPAPSSVPQQNRDIPAISSPRKLKSLNRSDTQSSSATSTGSSELPWYNRYVPKLWKKSTMETEAVEEKSSISDRPRPKLTITTSDGNMKYFDGSEPENNVPTSAWSVSPRKSTWMSNLAPPKFSTLHPKSRRTASVPNDVSPIDQDNTLAKPQPQYETAFAVPLHHTFTKTPLVPLSSPPPPAPNFQFPAYAGPMPTYSNNHLSPPASRSVYGTIPSPPGLPARPLTGSQTTSHARHQSSADPFATPFDDERYAVTVESPTSVRKSTSTTNPFVGMAL